MFRSGTGSRVAAAAIALSLVTAAAACGSDDDESSTTAGGVTNTAGSGVPDTGGDDTTPVECTGQPVKLASIFSVTGVGNGPFLGMKEAIEAAQAAVNKTCELGRPLSVDICDDKSDPNESAVCGRKAASEGALAIVGHGGTFEEGVSTAALPAIADGGGSSYMLTSPVAFTPTGNLTFSYGTSNLVKAAGATSMLFAAVDVPAIQALSGLLQSGAAKNGVTYDTVFFPPDTTDFASVAAQIASKKPPAVYFASPNPQPLVKALAAEGVTAKNTVMITAIPFADTQISDMGDLADGIYELGGAWPYNDTSNKGIAQMHDELKQADLDDSQITLLAVSSWSHVHAVVDALSKLTPEQLDALPGKPQAFVDAMVASSPIERPEQAPYDLSKPAWTSDQDPILGKFRSFSRYGLALRIDGGDVKVATDGFVDFSAPFELTTK